MNVYGMPSNGLQGLVAVDLTAADKVLSVEQAQSGVVEVSSTFVGTRSLRFPAPANDTRAYQRVIRNLSVDTEVEVDIVGGSSPVTIHAGGTGAIFALFKSTGIVLLSYP